LEKKFFEVRFWISFLSVVNEIISWLCKVERLVVLDFHPFMIELMAIMYNVFVWAERNQFGL